MIGWAPRWQRIIREPANLTLGRDGAIWFTEESSSIPAGGIGRLTTTGSFSDFQVPAPRSSPSTITFAPDGSLWFADPGAHKLGGAMSAIIALAKSSVFLVFVQRTSCASVRRRGKELVGAYRKVVLGSLCLSI